MLKKRASGVLMHLTSLPSRFGIGVMGEETKRFIDKISDMGFSYWQVLPLNPPDFFGSPYTSNSVFAISHMFIDPDSLVKSGLVTESDIERSVYYGSPYTADYEFAYNSRIELLRIAYKNAGPDILKKVEGFRNDNEWCYAHSLFNALKELNNNAPWYKWEEKDARFEKCAENTDEILEVADFYSFVQYIAFSQWKDIKDYANKKNVKIMGDMPIYVSMDSVDVWSNRRFFEIDDKDFSKKKVAGVPPDYFSADGQLWGNPLYNWTEMEKNNYKWWTDRIKSSFQMFDMVRIDHFRGFASYWAIPADSETEIGRAHV